MADRAELAAPAPAPAPALAPAPAPAPTPRSQLARVVIAAIAASVLGGGPALAWDLSTQLPQSERPSPWGKPSPWRDAGRGVKSAAGNIARLYLPRAHPSASASEEPAPAPPPPPTTTAAATAVPPTRPHPIPRVLSAAVGPGPR